MTNRLPGSKYIPLHIKTSVLDPHTFSKISFASAIQQRLDCSWGTKVQRGRCAGAVALPLHFFRARSKMPTVRPQQSCGTAICQRCQKQHWNVTTLNVTERGKRPTLDYVRQGRSRTENWVTAYQWPNGTCWTCSAFCLHPLPHFAKHSPAPACDRAVIAVTALQMPLSCCRANWCTHRFHTLSSVL